MEIDRRQQILDAALNVFAHKGFAAATIKEIAREAGLKSPALIYWYFPSKQDLLSTLALRLVPVMEQIAADPEPLMAIPPDMLLQRVAESFMAVLATPTGGKLIRLFLTEINHVPEIVEQVATIQKLMLAFLTRYLQHQIDLGRLKACDTQTATRIFVGSLLIYAMSSEYFPWMKEGLADPAAYARQVVDTFLTGMQP